MLSEKIAKLGSALLLLVGMGSMTNTWASHDYNMQISVYELPGPEYSVVVKPPAGLAPNSVCMQTWHVPSAPQEIAISDSFRRYFNITITDKNITSCSGSDKYNTWAFEIRKYLGTPGPNTGFQVVGQGRFQFRHATVPSGGWGTKITAMNSDAANPDDQPLLVYSAWCGNGKPPAPIYTCLNTYVTGDSNASNQISVYLGYPGR